MKRLVYAMPEYFYADNIASHLVSNKVNGRTSIPDIYVVYSGQFAMSFTKTFTSACNVVSKVESDHYDDILTDHTQHQSTPEHKFPTCLKACRLKDSMKDASLSASHWTVSLEPSTNTLANSGSALFFITLIIS
jgi:hypothetical protein